VKALTSRRRIRPRLDLNGTRPANPTAHLRLQGIAAALGTLARDHMQPDLAAMVLDSLGVRPTDLQAAGAHPYDFEPGDDRALTTPLPAVLPLCGTALAGK
jgi:hypothetical protein